MSLKPKPRVLLTGEIDFAKAEWNALSDIAALEIADSKDRSEFIRDLQGKYNGVFAISRTWYSETMTGPIDEELLAHYPESIKFICHNGAGYDQIDVAACSRKVANTPGVIAGPTSDVGIFLILGAVRNFGLGMRELVKGNWKNSVPRGEEAEDKLLGIVGMGTIGKMIATKAKALGMKIQYHNRNRLPAEKEAAAGNAEYVSFDELLATSDIISLNLPLNPTTRHIISQKEFEKMKDQVIIVNTARGALIDEDALVDALESGKVRSVGLDVYENEPRIHPALVQNDRVVLLPHMGTHTRETHKKMEIMVIENIRAAILEGRLLNPVN